VFEEVGAFLRAEGAQDFADGRANGFDGSCAGFSQVVFEFGEQLLDRVQVRGVFRQKDEMGAGLADRGPYRFAFVAAEIVHDDDISEPQGGNENFLDIEEEPLTIDRTVDQPGRLDAIVAECGEERHCVPVAVRRCRFEPLSQGAPAAQWRHVGLCPGLIDKNEPGRINASLIAYPLRAPSSHVGTILFFGQKCFF
jgi:hypothetical protein